MLNASPLSVSSDQSTCGVVPDLALVAKERMTPRRTLDLLLGLGPPARVCWPAGCSALSVVLIPSNGVSALFSCGATLCMFTLFAVNDLTCLTGSAGCCLTIVLLVHRKTDKEDTAKESAEEADQGHRVGDMRGPSEGSETREEDEDESDEEYEDEVCCPVYQYGDCVHLYCSTW
jgi:hypothetical protein